MWTQKTVLHFPKCSHRLFRLQEQHNFVSSTLSSSWLRAMAVLTLSNSVLQMCVAIFNHKRCLKWTKIIRKEKNHTGADRVQVPQCVSQQRKGQLGCDDRFLSWFIKEVDGLMRPILNQTVTPPASMHRHFHTQKPHPAFTAMLTKNFNGLFFNTNVLKTCLFARKQQFSHREVMVITYKKLCEADFATPSLGRHTAPASQDHEAC